MLSTWAPIEEHLVWVPPPTSNIYEDYSLPTEEYNKEKGIDGADAHGDNIRCFNWSSPDYNSSIFLRDNMTMSSDSLLESSELRSNNSRLNSTVNELRLEIEYYQGETKRLEWEKTLLKQDIGKMSTLFNGWLHELQNTCSRSVLDDSTYFSTLVRNPSKNIADVIQMTNLKILITTCQSSSFSHWGIPYDNLFIIDDEIRGRLPIVVAMRSAIIVTSIKLYIQSDNPILFLFGEPCIN